MGGGGGGGGGGGRPHTLFLDRTGIVLHNFFGS